MPPSLIWPLRPRSFHLGDEGKDACQRAGNGRGDTSGQKCPPRAARSIRSAPWGHRSTRRGLRCGKWGPTPAGGALPPRRASVPPDGGTLPQTVELCPRRWNSAPAPSRATPADRSATPRASGAAPAPNRGNHFEAENRRFRPKSSPRRQNRAFVEEKRLHGGHRLRWARLEHRPHEAG